MERSGIVKAAAQFGLGIVGLALVTLAAVRLNLQPGAVSLLYLIAIVFVSLRASFIPSFAISLTAVFLLQYYFVSLFSPTASKNPLAIVASVAFLLTAWVITAMVSRVRKMTEAQLTLRFEERLAERTRIARELHDTLLQSFQGALLKFHAVTYLLADRPEAQKTLETIIEQARQAITEARDAVQGLRSSAVVANDIVQALGTVGKELAIQQANGNSADFRLHVEGRPRNLDPIVCDEVYRIAGEALRNAFCHAQAGRIELEIRYDRRQFRVRVRDSGKGIDPNILRGNGRAGHYGLPGMHERAKLLGGKLAVWSERSSGTEAELTIPASVAYAKSPAPHRPLFFTRRA